MSVGQATATTEPVGAPAGTEPPRLTGPQPLTDALIDSISRGHCGWSKRQLHLLGVGWPPPSGWRQRLVVEGRILTGEEVEALYAARKKPKRPEGADNPESPLVPMPCPWCRRLVEPVTQGGRTKEFCCKRHKNLYNAALNRLSLTYARTIRTPGSLRIWAAARVDPSQSGGSALQAPGTPNGKPEWRDGPLAPRVRT